MQALKHQQHTDAVRVRVRVRVKVRVRVRVRASVRVEVSKCAVPTLIVYSS